MDQMLVSAFPLFPLFLDCHPIMFQGVPRMFMLFFQQHLVPFGLGRHAIQIKHALLCDMPRDLLGGELVLDGRKVVLARFKAPRDILDSPSRLAELRFQFSPGTFVSGALIVDLRPHLVELSHSLPFQLFGQLRRQGADGIVDRLYRAALLDLIFAQVYAHPESR
ncbi:hypothetical protein [Massilia sp. HP4]|uniref:hypothetical protein n=1 Tax=Massilia sp. HP4 TaxID=2562316 RepID=UPI0010C08256|nr:hypothetical protein [Massilia sp. HP4]